MTSDRSATGEPEPQQDAPEQPPAHKEAIAHLDQLWKVQPRDLTSARPLLGQAKNAANSLTRWYVQAIVEQQNAFNAAVVQALQQLSETSDRQQRRDADAQTQIDNIVAHLHALQSEVERLMGESGSLHQHIADIELHLCDIDDAQTALARQIAAPALETEPQS